MLHAGSIFIALVVLILVILIHEGGHYLAARLVGIRAYVFSIFFGPTLWKRQVGKTLFRIGSFPLGGYVAMAGMTNDPKSIREEGARMRALFEEKHTEYKVRSWYYRSSWWRQFLAVAAGPFANILSGFLVLVVLVGINGKTEISGGTRVESLVHGEPAEKAGMLPGDEILAINGVEVENGMMVSKLISRLRDNELRISLLRNGEVHSVKAIPVTGTQEQPRRIGITLSKMQATHTEVPLLHTPLEGLKLTGAMLRGHLQGMYLLFSGQLSPSNMSGPVGIVSFGAESVQGGISTLITFFVVISFGVALLNLLPLPVLDGGHLVFALYKGVTGTQPGYKFVQTTQSLGMLLLFGLFITITVSDVTHLIG